MLFNHVNRLLISGNLRLLFCSFSHLSAKLPQPGDSEVTFAVFEPSHLLVEVFESSCHLKFLLSV